MLLTNVILLWDLASPEFGNATNLSSEPKIMRLQEQPCLWRFEIRAWWQQ